MPTRSPIPLPQLVAPVFDTWDKGWFLLTAGTLQPREFNTMTVSWGAFGFLWAKPLAIVVVRPTRYTFEFMEKSPDFTLSAFPASLRPQLEMLGRKSGRSGDKVAESGLTPVPSKEVISPAFAQATLILECRKSYSHDLDPKRFIADYIAGNYRNDFHRVYFGEVVAAQGTEQWVKPGDSPMSGRAPLV